MFLQNVLVPDPGLEALDDQSARRLQETFFVAAVLFATVVGTWMRTRGLAETSLWLDEILNVGILREGDRRWYEWLIGFERENGPLYFALHALALRLPFPVEVTWRLPELCAGVATIPLIALAGRAVAGRWTGVAASIFVAVSPLHVYYSREGRPYALLMLGAVVGMLLLLRPPARPAVPLVALSIALAATAATAVPLILALAAAFLADSRRAQWVAGVVTIAGLLAAALFYGRFPPAEAVSGFDGEIALVPEILGAFGTWATGGIQRADLFLFAFAAVGVVWLVMRNRRGAGALISLAILPVALTLATLAVLDHWFSVRYVSPALPAYLILAAAGLAAVTTHGPRMLRRVGTVVVTILLFLWISAALPVASTRPLDRTDWKRLARIVWERSHPGDTLLTTSTWTAVSMRFHLEALPPRVRVVDARGSTESADFIVGRRPRLWIIDGGYDADSSMRHWACSFPRLASDPVEDVSLLYAHSVADFLVSRSTLSDAAAFRAAWVDGAAGLLSAGDGATAILGDGWHGPDPVGDLQFRWSRRASEIVVPPGPSGERLILELSPFPHQKGGPSILAVDFPDGSRQVERLRAGWQRLEVILPPRESPVLLKLNFDAEQSPAAIGESGDPRLLAAMFRSLGIGSPAAGERLGSITLAAEGGVASRSGDKGAPPADLRSRLQIGDDELERWRDRGRDEWELVALRITMQPCPSDREWLQAAYRVIMGREADREGQRHHLRAMREGTSRSTIAKRLGQE